MQWSRATFLELISQEYLAYFNLLNTTPTYFHFETSSSDMFVFTLLQIRFGCLRTHHFLGHFFINSNTINYLFVNLRFVCTVYRSRAWRWRFVFRPNRPVKLKCILKCKALHTSSSTLAAAPATSGMEIKHFRDSYLGKCARVCACACALVWGGGRKWVW